MERCDVLVLGGGPAGSSCAWQLRRSGLDVVVVDRKTFPRDKICAGWITPSIVEELELVLEDYAKERVLQPIHGFRVSQIGGAEARVDYGVPVSFGIRRCEFDDYLLRRSEARLQLGEPVRSLRRTGAGWRLNDALEARVLVGAGGHFCPVARLLLGAAQRAPEPVVAAQEIEFRLEADDRVGRAAQPELPELFFTQDLKGYGWLVRKADYLNLGFGRQGGGELGAHVAAFLEFLATRGKLPRVPGRLHGHAYLLHGQSARALFDDGVLLVGDAAGLAYPKSGEGIRPAVETGLLAARTLVAADGRYDRARLAGYAGAVTRRFGSREGGAADLSARLPARWKPGLARRLLASPFFARHVLLDRWFLHRRDAPLASA